MKKVEIKHKVKAPERADLVIKSICEVSRAEIRGMFYAGCVRVNGRTLTEPGTGLAAGAELELSYDSERRYFRVKPPFKSQLFRILHEDNHLLVIDKAAGFLTMPTENNDRLSLIAALNDYLDVKGSRSSGATLVHRLDRDTSGVLVVAKHPKLARTLKEQFAERKPHRRYIALVRGRLKKPSGTFRSYLATDEDLNQFSTADPEEGKLAITHYQVEREYDGVTRVEVKLETGRRNQIRVHFSEDGHPVIGDVRYRPEDAAHPNWTWRRLALHAFELGFVHPVTKRTLLITSPLPPEFAEFEKTLSPLSRATDASSSYSLGGVRRHAVSTDDKRARKPFRGQSSSRGRKSNRPR